MATEGPAGVPAVEVDGVRKEFRDGSRRLRALDGVSLRVERGECVAICGPSGSGKSTLLHLMGGLDEPSTGEVRIEGRRLVGLSDDDLTLLRRRRVGFVFQFFNLLPALTAEENVALPLILDGRPRPEIERRARAMLEAVGLASRGAHRPDALSGGEMQRVALARALVIEPAVVLADEPTGNLDAATGAPILRLLWDVGRALGRTTVLVTHDGRAAEGADRVITLSDGRLVAQTPRSR